MDYQTRFWYLPSVLRGLVFNANYTRTTSEAIYPRNVIEKIITFTPSFTIENVNLDSANKIPGYFDSPWPSECGGPRRQKLPRSKGLNVQNQNIYNKYFFCSICSWVSNCFR